MKKILLGCTALMSSLAMAGAVNAAEPLKLGVSGSMQEWFGVVKQENDGTAAAANQRRTNTFGINADTEIDFSAETKLDNGMVVHAQININTDNNDAAISVDKQWASLAGNFGTVYAGARESATDSMHNEAPDVGMAYEDVDMWIIAPANSASFGTRAAGGGNPFDATSLKVLINNPAPSIGYVSPQFGGFTLGATYSSAGAVAVGAVNKAGLGGQYNLWDAALAYSREYGALTVGADVGTGGGNGDANGANNVRAYNGGLKLAMHGFTVGGAYLKYMDVGTRHNLTSNAGQTWNVGASYTDGPMAVSMLYYREKHLGLTTVAGKEKFDTYMLSGKYALGPGVDLKSSLFRGKFKGKDGADLNNTSGTGLVTGLEITF